VLCGVISFGVLLALWHYSVGTIFNSTLVASPEDTFLKAWEMIGSGELLTNVWASVRRVIVGYVVGCSLGIFLGALIGRYRLVSNFVDPVLELIRPISPVALVPLAMLWFGIGEVSKYFIIVYATIVIVLMN